MPSIFNRRAIQFSQQDLALISGFRAFEQKANWFRTILTAMHLAMNKSTMIINILQAPERQAICPEFTIRFCSMLHDLIVLCVPFSSTASHILMSFNLFLDPHAEPMSYSPQHVIQWTIMSQAMGMEISTKIHDTTIQHQLAVADLEQYRPLLNHIDFNRDDTSDSSSCSLSPYRG